MKRLAFALGGLAAWNAFYKVKFTNEIAVDGKREIKVIFKPRWK